LKAHLILENGMRFSGEMFGAEKEVFGEVVFSTGMGGYQESLTDPSLAGQILTMTFPVVGAYGINSDDMESDKAHLNALIVREICDFPSNFRMEKTLPEFLKEQGVVGISGIDTRALTRVLRNNGTMKGAVVLGDVNENEVIEKIKAFKDTSVTENVSTKEAYEYSAVGDKTCVVIDLGTKKSLLESIKSRGYKVTVFPYNAKADEIMSVSPDVVFVTSGPGNPEDLCDTVNTLKDIIGKVKVSGVCLGHLVIGLALGCKAEKMKFGHHGENQPVKARCSGKVYITTQGHTYSLTELPEGVEQIFTNVNDGTCEGIIAKDKNVISLQFHPEANPGPKETGFLFDDLLGKEVK